MERKVNTNGTVLAFATYKPKEGQEEALMALVEKHLPVLRELQLATDRANYIARSKDGSIIEVFEWTSMDAINAAHQHPAVTDIWEKMTMIADFLPMSALPEANRPFPGFEMTN
jgi:quinol monooxygenase YgiN